MAYLVKILDSAVEDIAQLITYLRSRWSSDVAENAYIELMDKLALLETQPQLGSVVAELAQSGFPNYRLLVHDKHTKILYRVDDGREIVHVHIVFSSKQDFQTLLYHRIIRQA